jgi:hypothetical protein
MLLKYTQVHVGRDSSVGTATGCGLDGPGIESGGGEIFRTRQDRSWGPAHPASFTMGTGYFPEVKQPGRGADHPPSSAQVKNE